MFFSKYFLKLCYLAKKGLILFVGGPKSTRRHKPEKLIRGVKLLFQYFVRGGGGGPKSAQGPKPEK